MLNRRSVLQAAGTALGLSAIKALAAGGKATTNRKTIALLVYPGFTALDLVGPHHVFSLLGDYDVQLVWKSTESVKSDTGLAVKPTMTIKDCPSDLAVVFVPGGTTGTVQMMGDTEILSFLKSRADSTDYITSVCTGSLVLGAAGLLRGYKATSHWGAREILKHLGAEPINERVVCDRNRITGGGVTAGIDFALVLASRLKDEEYAKAAELMMEYAPSPPFKTGSPATAGDKLTKQMQAMFVPFVQAATFAAEKARANW